MCPAGLLPSSRSVCFPTLRLTSTNLYLELRHLAYTERFQKKWLSETYCFICWKEVENNIGYISFLFIKAHKRNVFWYQYRKIYASPKSGFIFILWPQRIMELIMSSLCQFLERVKSTNYSSPLANASTLKAHTFVYLTSFLALFYLPSFLFFLFHFSYPLI